MVGRRSIVAAAVMTAAILAGSGSAIGQSEGSDASTVCNGWGWTIEGGTEHIPKCSLPRVTHEDLGTALSPQIAGLFELMGAVDLVVVYDPIEDRFDVVDGRFRASGSDAADIEAVYKGDVDLGRRQRKRVENFLRRDLPVDWILTTGQPLDRLLANELDVFFFDTVGDPTLRPEGNLVYQIAFMSLDADKLVIPLLPQSPPLMGSQLLATAGRFPGAGSVRDLVAMSDFGGKVGPDGQTAYYNLPPALFSIFTPEGVVLVTLDRPNRLGYRPEAYDASSDAWDIVAGPGGPMAFIPADGTGYDLVSRGALSLTHEQLDGQTFQVDGAPQIDVALPSFFNYLIESPALTSIEPAPDLTASLSLKQRRLLFDAIDAAFRSADDMLILGRHGIPTFGIYCLEDLSPVKVDGAAWSDGIALTEEDAEALKALTRELVRALGTSCWQVGEDGGFLAAAAHAAGADQGLPFHIPNLPPEVAAVLEAAGLEEIGPGTWDIPLEPEDD